jgi:hypothetical protein
MCERDFATRVAQPPRHARFLSPMQSHSGQNFPRCSGIPYRLDPSFLLYHCAPARGIPAAAPWTRA